MALTKLNNKAVANVTSIPVALGDMVLVSSATASSSASIEFTLGNYKEYQFYFVNLHPSVDNATFEMNFSTDNGSNYNVTKTTTFFQAYHFENGAATNLQYSASADLAQSTGEQRIISGIDDDNDSSGSGFISVFNPSSTTFVKHFISQCNTVYPETPNLCVQQYVAGYANTTSALTNIRFQMSSGNIDAGTILMYGIN